MYCGRFQRAKNFDCIAQNTFHKTSAKHRKTPQNTAKQSQNAFCEITSQNNAKQTQNAQKSHKTVALQPQYVLRAFGVFFKNTLDLSQKYTMRNTRKLRITRGVTYPHRGSHVPPQGVTVFQKTVFCGVLRCFVCVFLAYFTKQHKTDQKIYKKNKTNKIRFVQYSAIRCCASFSHSENVYKKHSQNMSKTACKTSAKHRKTPQNTVLRKTLAKHRKTPAKHPQNTAKHWKTPQNRLANKTDRIS